MSGAKFSSDSFFRLLLSAQNCFAAYPVEKGTEKLINSAPVVFFIEWNVSKHKFIFICLQNDSTYMGSQDNTCIQWWRSENSLWCNSLSGCPITTKFRTCHDNRAAICQTLWRSRTIRVCMKLKLIFTCDYELHEIEIDCASNKFDQTYENR